MKSSTFFVDVFAFGASAKTQAALRQVRQRLLDDEASCDCLEVSASREADVDVSAVPGLSSRAVARNLSVVIQARSLAPVVEDLWSSTFVSQGGVMAVVAMDPASPTPVFGWLNRQGNVFKQGWDLPKGSEPLGVELMRQFLELPVVKAHLSDDAEAPSVEAPVRRRRRSP